MMVAHQSIAIFHIIVVVILQGGHVNQSLYAVIQLHKEAKAGNTADNSFEGVPHELLHVFYLLEVGGVPLRRYCHPFPLGSMLRHFWQLLNQLLPPGLWNAPCGKALPKESVYY